MVATAVDVLKVVGFSLAGQHYAVDILRVKKIQMLMPVTRVPSAAAYIEGVVNLRGEIVTIVNLRRKLSLEEAAPTDESRIIVIDQDGRMVGIIVDAVSDVQSIPVGSLVQAPAVAGGIDASFTLGVASVGDRMVIVLDIDQVLAPHASGRSAPTG